VELKYEPIYRSTLDQIAAYERDWAGIHSMTTTWKLAQPR